MIGLPEGFNAGNLFGELFQLAAPFVGIAFIIGCGVLITRIIKRAS